MWHFVLQSGVMCLRLTEVSTSTNEVGSPGGASSAAHTGAGISPMQQLRSCEQLTRLRSLRPSCCTFGAVLLLLQADKELQSVRGRPTRARPVLTMWHQCSRSAPQLLAPSVQSAQGAKRPRPTESPWSSHQSIRCWLHMDPTCWPPAQGAGCPRTPLSRQCSH